ncbi:hypothetical protein SAMN05660282_02218 [Corynebacterium spheniscorum]|uniref:Uncharacterized protein n=1 Tax=Corynebacterium spheniscorum TaxID=185761 RepID=A0A1I2VDF4_9CORY|nr:hypothetical protein SAMN05660282_02218 [Corynebacterium spheniscorum]
MRQLCFLGLVALLAFSLSAPLLQVWWLGAGVADKGLAFCALTYDCSSGGRLDYFDTLLFQQL